jgi:nucleoside phosphorylase
MTDCAIITALPKENEAVLFHFRNWTKITPSESTRTFYQTTMPNGLRVVAAMTSGMGSVHAATLAAELLERYKPKTMILVGIAGAMDREIRLGDVVASEQIVDYDTGKLTPEGYGPRWSVYRTDERLSNLVKNWKIQGWQSYISVPRPDGKPSMESKLRSGLYLSGNKVIADENTAGSLKSVWLKAAAVEMEATGVAAAIHSSGLPVGFLVMKSICDYADSHKGDDWQDYAADAAASCAIAFVSSELTASIPSGSLAVDSQSMSFSGYDPQAIRLAMSRAYSLEELRVLCFDIGIEWEDIEGITKSGKVANLLDYVRRRNKIDKLLDHVNRDRDNIIKTLGVYEGDENLNLNP